MSTQENIASVANETKVPQGLLATALSSHGANTSTARNQRTLRGQAQCTGVGVHSGEKATLRLLPADIDTGIVFLRTDLKNGARTISARWDFSIETQLCTQIGNGQGGKVSTIEHVMAALSAAGIDNATIEVDGPEVPIMDGSADPFVFMIEMAGIVEQKAPCREIIIRQPVLFESNGKRVSLLPSDERIFDVSISFDRKLIQNQHYVFSLEAEGFKSEISRARTFGFFEDVEKMTKLGFMRGGSLENAVVVKGDEIMNEGGLRYENEFVRHKLLDAVGDIAMAGHPIRGRYEGVCPGHAMNNQLLRALFANEAAWEWSQPAQETAPLSA